MVIGLIKEIKNFETRVGLLPEQVKILKESGHKVFVENGAGEKSGFTDEEYKVNGALLATKDKIFNSADMIIKVKCPLVEEYKYLQDGQILFTYLHFDENIPPENINQIVASGVTGIAYEWVEEDGDFVLLRPMSEITGILFALQSMKLLIEKKGVLPVGLLEGVQPPTALVIGMGKAGTNAVKVFLANGMNVVIIEKDVAHIEERGLKYVGKDLWSQTADRRKIIEFDNINPQNTIDKITGLMSMSDILLNCAVRGSDLPKSKMEYLVTRQMVSLMKKGSVVCDVTACDKDLIETAVSSEELYETYEVEGVVHYNCDHIPSLVPNTSSRLLSEKTFPYIKLLANKGFVNAIKEKESLFKGVMCYGKELVHKYSADKKNMPYKELKK
jgi:alanine dehydrogenase